MRPEAISTAISFTLPEIPESFGAIQLLPNALSSFPPDLSLGTKPHSSGFILVSVPGSTSYIIASIAGLIANLMRPPRSRTVVIGRDSTTASVFGVMPAACFIFL